MMRLYIEVSAFLATSLLASVLCSWAFSRTKAPMSSKHQLILAQILFLASLLVPAAVAWTPREALFAPSVEVWSASEKKGSLTDSDSAELFFISSSTRLPRASLEVARDKIALVTWALIVFIVFGIGVLIARLRQVERVLSNLPTIRTLGRVRIVVSDEYPVPFAAMVPGRAFVVLPTSLISNRRDYRIAIRHELQHHRQNDPLWAIAVETVRALFPWHPVVRAWARHLEQLQEFACDEALVGQRQLSTHDYSHCLLRAAQSAMGSSHGVLGATAMAGPVHNPMLRKRIEMILNHSPNTKHAGIWVVAAFSACAIGAMASLAYASRSAIQAPERRISQALAEALIRNATLRGNAIPLEANARVMARLNEFVGTPDGRHWMKESLTRMKAYEPMIRQKLVDSGLPEDLLALPLLESGYRNDVSSPRSKAIGIWQFIPSTARLYKLTEEAGRDDRLDPERQTDAAIRLLMDLHDTFDDWRLALKAYNEGTESVSVSIAKRNTRDPWTLENSDSTEDYLAGAIAAMIIIRSPDLLD